MHGRAMPLRSKWDAATPSPLYPISILLLAYRHRTSNITHHSPTPTLCTFHLPLSTYPAPLPRPPPPDPRVSDQLDVNVLAGAGQGAGAGAAAVGPWRVLRIQVGKEGKGGLLHRNLAWWA